MIRFVVTGLNESVRKLRAVEAKIPAALARALGRSGQLIAGRVRLKLSGEVLKVQTGRLRQSVGSEVSNEGTTLIIGAGAGGVEYAAIHEFGFHGPEQVRAHERTITRVFGRKLKAARRVLVRAHTRQMNMPARPYLRPSIEEGVQDVREQIAAELNALVEGA